MNIEEFRYNRLCEYFIQVTDLKTGQVSWFQTNYASYAESATKAIIGCFGEAENPIVDMKLDGYQAISSFVFSFLALETYINGLAKVLDHEEVLEFGAFKKQDLDTRINELLKVFKIDRKEISRSNVYKILNEYKTVRNELFHDRQFDSTVKLDHTIFASVPYYISFCDAIEAFKCFLTVVQVFRFSFFGVDLMPYSRLENSNGLNYFRLDDIYEKLLVPWYFSILAKHKLGTKFSREIRVSSQTIDFRRDDFKISILLYYESDHGHRLDTFKKTNFGLTFGDTLGGMIIPLDQMAVPSYARKP